MQFLLMIPNKTGKFFNYIKQKQSYAKLEDNVSYEEGNLYKFSSSIKIYLGVWAFCFILVKHT